eukprot:TRINITY_DN9420_c0_g2_i1.p1 TRINITY_DN9420_c0_g2~~TRINITY_DN9420_c0_g2_i1.p1  ORF type:complete len:234 (+),score=38.36 TRINITY_DN9420_c0_g2_i1:123-824(+)
MPLLKSSDCPTSPAGTCSTFSQASTDGFRTWRPSPVHEANMQLEELRRTKQKIVESGSCAWVRRSRKASASDEERRHLKIAGFHRTAQKLSDDLTDHQAAMSNKDRERLNEVVRYEQDYEQRWLSHDRNAGKIGRDADEHRDQRRSDCKKMKEEIRLHGSPGLRKFSQQQQIRMAEHADNAFEIETQCRQHRADPRSPHSARSPFRRLRPLPGDDVRAVMLCRNAKAPPRNDD